MNTPAFRGTALTLLVAMAACGRSDRNRTPATRESASSRSVAASAAAPGAVALLPGALTKPIDAMSGDELFAFAHGLRFVGGNERRRRCRGDVQCRGAGATRSTTVRVDAVDTQDSISATGMPPNGVLAARALNRGQLADTMYGTRPGAYEYYLIVQTRTGGGMTWRLEELTTTAGARSHRGIATGPVRECGHPFVRGARADFKTCSDAAAQVRPAAFTKFPRLQTDGEPPVWFACASGCCTAGPPDGTG